MVSLASETVNSEHESKEVIISVVLMLQVANITNINIFIPNISKYRSDTDIWEMNILYNKT